MAREDEEMFQSIDTDTSLQELEKEVRRFWEKNNILSKTRSRERDKKFGFTEGPPTANGLPHIGHVLTRVIKDIYLRYKTMDGYQIVPNIAGWDTHGLPVEIEVEKELGIDSKEEILEFGLEKFNELCKESVFKYEKEWREMSERIGFWIDYDNAYITMEDDYIESVWWSLKEIWEAGLLEEGHKVVPYCPRCGTPLSSHEVAQGYEQVRDPSIYVRFKLKDEDAYLLAWTTTPWTLISNQLLVVGKDIDYVLVQHEDERYYLAEALLDEIFEDADIVQRLKGKELIGSEYEPMFDYVTSKSKSHYITHADFVSLDEGTGIVHIAPAFGLEDHELCQAEGVDLVNPVDESGKFKKVVPDYAGKFVKEADGQIMTDLYERGDLVKRESVKHTYPFCWRCDSPLLYYALESWFIRTSKEKNRLIENNDRVRWKPEHLKHGRFGNFLEDLKDWSLSRNRFWGTPLPIWTCQNGHEHCVGSKKELEEMATAPLEDDFELHRPWVDRVKLSCPECDEIMTRVEYVIDCWYDSGSAPFAQFHYPFEGEDDFQESFPIDFITEALDQTRGWFYSLLAISSLLFDEPAYLSCLTLGLVLDEDGEKMSKSKGNAVDPMEAIENVGADAIRLYFLSMPVWKSSRFSEELAKEKINKTINTLINISSFFVNNANIDGFIPNEYEPTDELDLWLLSKKNTLVNEVRKELDDLNVHKATQAIEGFVQDVSNWYLRLSRRRFWEGEGEDKNSAYNTLFDTLKTLLKSMAPFTPFLAERLYRKIVLPVENGAESIHLLDYPVSNLEEVDEELEDYMDTVIRVAELGRNARQRSGIKLRQPLNKAIVVTQSKHERKAVNIYRKLLGNELNVKKIKITDPSGAPTSTEIEPDLSSLGPKFKGQANKVASLIKKADVEWLVSSLKEGDVNLEGYTIAKEDVNIKESVDDSFTLSKDDGLEVYIDTIIDEELEIEGITRDVVRRIQTMRKELDLGYTQRIKTNYVGDPRIEEAVSEMESYILKETLSDSIVNEEGYGYHKDWQIDGRELKLWVDPVE